MELASARAHPMHFVHRQMGQTIALDPKPFASGGILHNMGGGGGGGVT